ATFTAGPLFGGTIARLGDFNGDTIDDFAIGAYQWGGVALTGRVFIIKGKVGFGSVVLPDTTNSIVIDGDATLTTPLFGYRIVGLGKFYGAPTTSGTTMIVGAPGTSAGTAGSEGRVYAFHGQNGSGGTISIGSADQVVVGPALKTRLGSVLSNLGPM